MKKIYILTQAKEKAASLEALRELGLLHIEHVNPPSGKTLSDLHGQVQNMEKALAVLEPFKTAQQKESPNGSHHAEEVLKLDQEAGQLAEQLTALDLQIKNWEPWGEFEPNDLRYLAHHGVHINLYEIPAKKLKKASGDLIPVYNDGQTAKAIGINLKHAPYREVALPAHGLKALKHQAHQIEHKIKNIRSIISEHGRYYQAWSKTLETKRNDLELHKAAAGMGQTEELVYLKGFCPSDQVDALKIGAKNNHWGLLIEDPSDEDRPPTLLKNPDSIGMIKPIFDFMNISPGYREQDVSFVFLLFFTMFFSILIGDAGYGSVFLMLFAFVHKKAGKKVDHKVFLLGYTLSIGTIIWGVMTGTYFGTTLTANLIKPAVPWLTVNEHVQELVFTIGVVHLTVAHGWRAYNQLRVKNWTGFIDIGWILILWACYFAVLYFVIHAPLSPLTLPLAAAGGILIAVFSKFDIIGLFLGSLGAFGDIVSYIRLFAVGLASVAVADAFNNMGMSIGFSNPGSAIGACLVIGLGHILNMVLSLFAILVHGIRLKVMEFSGHLGIEWTGTQYQPLKKTVV